MEHKKENRTKVEHQSFLAISVLALSTTILMVLWALFFVVSFAKTLTKISPFKRKIGKGNTKENLKKV